MLVVIKGIHFNVNLLNVTLTCHLYNTESVAKQALQQPITMNRQVDWNLLSVWVNQ